MQQWLPTEMQPYGSLTFDSKSIVEIAAIFSNLGIWSGTVNSENFVCSIFRFRGGDLPAYARAMDSLTL